MNGIFNLRFTIWRDRNSPDNGPNRLHFSADIFMLIRGRINPPAGGLRSPSFLGGLESRKMGKCLVVLIISAAVCAFVAGCPRAKPRAAEPVRIEPVQAVPPAIEPNLPESPAGAVEQEPDAVVPASVEPNEVNSVEMVQRVHQPGCSESVEPNAPVTIEAEPNKVEPVVVEPNKAEPAVVEPNKVGPVAVEPNKVGPNEAKPVASEPNKVGVHPADSFYDKYAGILKSCVDNRGMVNYKLLKRKRLELKNLLDGFAGLDPNEYNRWPKEDKIALWINAYNIQMLKIICENYPIEGSRFLNPIYGPNSIRHIKGIWTDYKFIVMDEEFTLAEVERRFLSKEFAEPKVFFAVSHASLSGPPLRNEPYYGHKLYQQLEDQTKKFLSNPLAFRIDRVDKRVNLSAMFQDTWRGKEFVGLFGTDKKFKDQEPATRAVLNFITKYLPPQDVDFLEVENYSVKFMRYDWTLNDTSQ